MENDRGHGRGVIWLQQSCRNRSRCKFDYIVYTHKAIHWLIVLSHKKIKPVTEHTMIESGAKEDISMEAFQQRHERALADERKKFSTFLKFPYSTRSRANRRTDSQADSSGANTPDPMSPAPSTPATMALADQEVISLEHNSDSLSWNGGKYKIQSFCMRNKSAPPTPQSVDAADNTNDVGKFQQSIFCVRILILTTFNCPIHLQLCSRNRHR